RHRSTIENGIKRDGIGLDGAPDELLPLLQRRIPDVVDRVRCENLLVDFTDFRQKYVRESLVHRQSLGAVELECSFEEICQILAVLHYLCLQPTPPMPPLRQPLNQVNSFRSFRLGSQVFAARIVTDLSEHGLRNRPTNLYGFEQRIVILE
ncbi:hypothetical protein PFISCL1PPCAC_13158, partial [Pristionchus fissidentatus]